MALKSWLTIAPDSDFSLANLPFGIISNPTNSKPRPAVAIGEYAIDLATFSMDSSFDPELSAKASIFQQTTLNAFAALGRPFHRKVRRYLQSVLAENTSHILKSDELLQKRILIPLSDTKNHLPMDIGDYTDFFAGRNHAFNAGVLFRGPENALQPNYHHLPVAYHSRSSSIVVSGTEIYRPRGQALVDPKAEVKVPEFRECKVLDFELELGMFLCRGNGMGSPIDVNISQDHIFGYVLLNDWSARDIQAWEYVPLGPFTAKNFATTISPWIVLADAMETFGAPGIVNETEVQPYLCEKKSDWALDITLEVDLTSSDGTTSTITKTNARNLMWSFPQMIAHHTITGCPLRPGDLFGSGTISGTEEGGLGSLLEMTQGGKQSIKLADGGERKYLQDGDSVSFRGRAGAAGAYVGFGKCTGTILPARS